MFSTAVKKMLLTKRFKTFLISFLLSLPFWWGINVLEKNLEELFFFKVIAENPQILTAKVVQEEEKLKNLRPARKREIEDFNLEAQAGISVFFKEGRGKVLFKKEEGKKLPIASLTKLMTAFVVLEHYDLSQTIRISESAVKEEGDFTGLKIGERFLVKDLLYPLLISSSNDTAIALAEIIGEDAFVDLMNLEAKELGLENTYFFNPTGLDRELGPVNQSTCQDLVNLAQHLFKKYPEVFEILSLREFNLFSLDGHQHLLLNRNELLGEIPEIIGGKTGYTEKAKGCLILLSKKNEGFLISVILGSDQRFEEMKNLLNWIDKAYRF